MQTSRWPLSLARKKREGAWNHAAQNVKLHIPTYTFFLPGIPHDDVEAQTNSRHQASSEQVRKYAAKVAEHVAGTHFTGEVVEIAPEETGKLKRVSYIPREAVRANKLSPRTIHCRHVIQATGFEGYGGAPHFLGVPSEIHSSHLNQKSESLRGKNVLLVGSGKSSIDAAHLLVQQGNRVRCLYRSATAYTRRSFNSPFSSLVMLFHPRRHFTME